MSLFILHQTVSLLDLLKTEDFPRIRIKFLSRHHSDYLGRGTSDKGNSGVPKTKLPKKLKWTPLAICRRGLKSRMGASPPKNPARQTRPPLRAIQSKSTTVMLPISSRISSNLSEIRSESCGPSINTSQTRRASSWDIRFSVRVVAVT